jgi:hypothetical protein
MMAVEQSGNVQGAATSTSIEKGWGGAAPNSTAIIIGRVIQGCGAAGILQGALVISTNTVPLQKRPLYISIVIIAFGLCVKIGSLLRGTFTELPMGFWMYVFILLWEDNRKEKGSQRLQKRSNWRRCHDNHSSILEVEHSR